MMKLFLISLVLIVATPSFPKNRTPLTCVALKGSDQAKGWHRFVISDDHQLLASYDYNESKTKIAIRLWATSTGKLLGRKTVDLLGGHYPSPELMFSTKNRFLYLNDLIVTNADYSNPRSIIPFWNLATNQLTISSCEVRRTGMKVQFSNEGKVAYTKVDYHSDQPHSLCSTFEKKLFVQGNPSDFDSQTKQLFEKFATKDYQYFHQLNQHLKQSAVNKKITLYSPQASDKSATKVVASHNVKSLLKSLSKEPLPKELTTSPHLAVQNEKTKNLILPGSYENDEDFKATHNFHKYGHYLLFEPKGFYRGNVFIFDLRKKQGKVIDLEGHFMNFEPYWLAEAQQLIFGVDREDYRDSINLYDFKKQRLQTIHITDRILFTKWVLSKTGTPQLRFMSYSEQENQARYCRL